jgi:hypothetical protein
MKQISYAEAFRDLNNWSKESRVGCVYTVWATDAVFSVRRAIIDIRGSDLFVDADTGKGLMHLRDCTFELTERGDLPLELKRGFPPLASVAIRTVFSEGDVCFFFPDPE